jgi:hypothetical protein
MRLSGDVARSCHTAPTDHESAGRLLVDHDEARTAIVLMIGRMHTASHSRWAKASHAHEYLPRCACEQDLVAVEVKPQEPTDGPEVEAAVVMVDE